MKTRKKTWSLPLAMVTALLLVGLLGAAVLAQGRNATPRIASLDDVEVRINNQIGDQPAVAVVELAGEEGKITDGTTVTVVQPGPDGDLEAEDDNITVRGLPEQLAVTVMTNNISRAAIALVVGAGTYNATAAPATNPVLFDVDNDPATDDIEVQVPSAVASWWDMLTNAKKIAALGLDTDQIEDDDESCDTLCDEDGDIFDYADAGVEVSTAAEGFEDTNGQLLITQAFHWDMLSAAQMVAVATAAGIDDDELDTNENDYDVYKARFAGLDQIQRDAVEGLYGTYLERGIPSTLTVTHGGVVGGDAENDFRDMRIGEAEVTVKVSDGYGRLIPPPSGSNTVGESFNVDLQGLRLGQVDLIGTNPILAGPQDVRLIAGDPETDEPPYTLRISGEALTVATISIDADAAGDDSAMGTSSDSSRGRLYNGTGLGLSVNATGVRGENGTSDTFTIKLEEYDKLRDGGTFTFRGYALTEEVNWAEVEFTIQLAIGNQKPVFAEGTEAAVADLSVSEAVDVTDDGFEIYDFDAADPDHTSDLEFRLSGDTTDADGNKIFDINEDDGKLTVVHQLNYQGDETDGCPGPGC